MEEMGWVKNHVEEYEEALAQACEDIAEELGITIDSLMDISAGDLYNLIEERCGRDVALKYHRKAELNMIERRLPE